LLSWLAQKNYPDLFKDIDMEKEVHTYYEKFYDVQLSPEEINFVFNPKREAAAGVK
jgi:iron complex transport system substrate-binding protein